MYAIHCSLGRHPVSPCAGCALAASLPRSISALKSLMADSGDQVQAASPTSAPGIAPIGSVSSDYGMAHRDLDEDDEDKPETSPPPAMIAGKKRTLTELEQEGDDDEERDQQGGDGSDNNPGEEGSTRAATDDDDDDEDDDDEDVSSIDRLHSS